MDRYQHLAHTTAGTQHVDSEDITVVHRLLVSTTHSLWASCADIFRSPSPPSIDAQAGNETLATNTTIIPSLRWDNDTRIAVGYMISHPVSAAGFLARDSWTRWNAGEQDTYVKLGPVDMTLTS